MAAVAGWAGRRWADGAGRRALVRFVVSTSPPLALLGSALTVAGALLAPATLLATGRLVAAVVGRRSATGPVVAIGLLLVAGQVLAPVTRAVTGHLGRRVGLAAQRRAMAAVQRPAGLHHLEDPGLRDLVTRACGTGLAGAGPTHATPSLFAIAGRWLAVIGSAVLVARFSAPLAVGLVVAGYATYAVLRADLIADVSAQVDETQASRRGDDLLDLALQPRAAKEVRTFGLGGWLLDRFTGEWRGAMAHVWSARRRGSGRTAAVLVLDSGALLLGYAVVAVAGVRRDVPIDQVAVLLGAVGACAGFDISNDDLYLAWGAEALPALGRLEQRCEELAAADRGGRPLPAGSPRAQVRLEGVRFAYPGRDAEVLAGLDLTLEAGTSLAVVGVNGAGKTTLVEVLAGLRRPTAGRVLVDGTPLGELDLRAWQRSVAPIFQDFTRYPMSALDNVALGAVQHLDDEDGTRAAARLAGVEDVVERLPDGWATVLDRRYEGGAELSGGQWQRLALARALFAVRGGATVLVLDEPTANLDARAEAELFDRFLELTRGVTTVLVSHRFSTVRRADRIAVLEAGRVVELGGHHDLLALGGRYARMFRLQAARFAAEAPGEVLDG